MRRLIAGYFLLVLPFLISCGGADSPSSHSTTVPVASITISPGSAGVVIGSTVQLTATLKDSAGGTLTGQAVVWAASPSSVAKVGSDGLVTGLSTGSVTITATSGGKSGSALIGVAGSDVATIGPAGGTMTTADGNVTLTFPAGALASATQISISPLADPKNFGLFVAGPAYDLGPTGTHFAVPVTLSIKYPATLPSGADPAVVGLYTLNGSTWERLPRLSTNVSTHTASALIDHFSGYMPCGQSCYPNDPKIIFGAGGLLFSFINAGSSIQVPWALYSYYYSGSYTLSVDPLPAGLTASWATTSQGSILTVNAIATMPAGDYDVPIRVSGPGIPDGLGVQRVRVIPPSYAISSSPSGVSIPQSGNAPSTVTLARGGAFTGTVALTMENLPNGVTASFSPASVSGNTSTVTLTAGASVPAGEYAPFIRGTTPGLADVTSPFGLTITATTTSGFTVVGTPALVSVTAGASGSTGLKATRTGGFGGTISYPISGLVSGLTATVTSTSVADSSKLTVTAASGLAPGTYPIVVNATSGATVVPVPVAVTVSAPGQVSVHLDYAACSSFSKPIWVAFQDGSGTFTRITPVGDVYDFTMLAAKGAIAYVLAGGGGFTTNVDYGTQAEFTTRSSHPQCSTSETTISKTVNASVLNTPSISVNISLGSSSSFPVNAGVGIPVVLSGVSPGPLDAIAFTAATPRLAIIRRDQNIANGGTLAPFDFASGEAFTEASANLSVPGAVSVGMGYVTNQATCATNTLYAPSTITPTTFYGIPASQQRPGDLHFLTATGPAGQVIGKLFHSMADQNLTFGGALSSVGVSNANGTVYKQLNVSLTLPGDYNNMSLLYTDTNNGFALSATTAYAGGQGFSLAAPNLAGVAGYQASWAPNKDSTVNYGLFADGSFTGCSEGATLKRATLSGTM